MNLNFLILLLALSTGFTLEMRLPVVADDFYADELQNVYFLKGNVVQKQSLDGKFNYKFSSNRYGDITSLDITRPLKPLLFYRNQGQMIILDNTMSMQGQSIDLFTKNLGQITTVASSVSDHYWLYNTQNFELLRVDRSFKVVENSGNLTQVLGESVSPNFMVEIDNWLYVNDPEIGILVFDIYGTYAQTIPVKGLDFFQVIGGKVYYQKENELHVYDRKSFVSETIELPVKEFREIRVSANKLYVLKLKWLEVYADKK